VRAKLLRVEQALSQAGFFQRPRYQGGRSHHAIDILLHAAPVHFQTMDAEAVFVLAQHHAALWIGRLLGVEMQGVDMALFSCSTEGSFRRLRMRFRIHTLPNFVTPTQSVTMLMKCAEK